MNKWRPTPSIVVERPLRVKRKPCKGVVSALRAIVNCLPCKSSMINLFLFQRNGPGVRFKNGMQKYKALILGLCSLLFLSSCSITSNLYKGDSYVERVSSVLISSDKEKLVVISSKYHYIFDAPVSLISTLNSSFVGNIDASFSDFVVDGSNQIAGEVILHLDVPKISIGQRDEAHDVGFERTNALLHLKAILSGVRYASGEAIDELSTYNLSTRYEIRVFEPNSISSKIKKPLLTPITLAADGVKNLGIIILIPIFAITYDG